MRLTFRKRIRIAPGIHWNIGLRGTSVSIGPRGAKFTVGTRGARASASLPGTGLALSQSLTPSGGRPAGGRGAAESVLALATPTEIKSMQDPTLVARMGYRRGRQLLVATACALIAVLGFLVAMGAFAAGEYRTSFVLVSAATLAVWVAKRTKSPESLARAERDRRFKVLSPMLLDAHKAGTRAALDAFVAKQRELDILDTDMPETAEAVHAQFDLFDFVELTASRGGKLPEVTGHERIVGNQPCFFSGPALHDKRGPNDETGTLYLAESQLIFVGATRAEAPWSKVASVSRDGRVLQVQRRDRQTPLVFAFGDTSPALRAEHIAKALLEAAPIH